MYIYINFISPFSFSCQGKTSCRHLIESTSARPLMEQESTAMWFWITSLLLTTIAILGNALVLYLIITRRRLRTKANWFLFSLAVADIILVAVFIPPHFGCQIAGCSHSMVILHLVSYFGEVSATNIMAFTVDRYCAIVLPLKYTHIITTKTITLLLMSAWLAPLILDVIPTLVLPDEDIAQLTSMAIFQITPCIFLAIAMTKIIKIANSHSRRTSTLLKQLKFNHPSQRLRGKSDVSSTRLISVMVGIFLACYICQSLSSLCACFRSCKELQPEEVVRYTLSFLLIINSGANPFVYALFKRDIKKEFSRMFLCKRRTER